MALGRAEGDSPVHLGMSDDMNTATQTPVTTDVTNCDREPIHIPGAILPHGAMLVLEAETLDVLQLAGDVTGLLGVSPEDLLGQSIGALFQPEQIENLRALGANFPLLKPRHLLDPQMRTVTGLPLDASLHRSDGALVLEFEAADTGERFAADPLAAVQEMVEGLENAASIIALCQMAAERVRDVALYDRVLVYQFMPDESGWVIAESKAEGLEPFLDLHYPAADIPKQARALYVKNGLRLITQVNYEPARLVPTNNPKTGNPLDMSQAILRDVSPIHREYLRNMGIDASMSISIIIGGALWGLIACHHYSPRVLPRHLRAICELFGSMFSYQLEVFDKRDQFNTRLTSRMVLQELMLNLASADDYARGLTEQSPNLLDYIHGGAATLDGKLQGGVSVCVKGELTFLGTTPNDSQINALVDWLNTHMRATEGVYATDRLGEMWEPAKDFADVASGLLVISVSPEPSDFIIWFRPELAGTALWAGKPIKAVAEGPDGAVLSPRKSFEIWKETVRGRGLPWKPEDLDAARDLRTSLLNVVLRRITDATRERKLAADRDLLLMAELDHRVKNTLANIEALVMQTSVSADSLSGFVEGLAARIQSMAKAHSLLSQSRWEGVSINSLLMEELDPYIRDHLAFEIAGPDIVLTSKSALALSLAVHELATNAAKYGALSTTNGRVSIRWHLTEPGGVDLSWIESGGPPVVAPTRRGFGSTLIERALAMETNGRATLRYLPTGVICDIALPPASLAPSGEVLPEIVFSNIKEQPDRSAKDIRVLVVEDSFMIASALETVFETFGWTMVGPATRVPSALALIETESFDVVLLDVNLDGEMSWDVAAALRARSVPFVLSTGYEIGALLPDFLKGSKFIRKPFKVDDIQQSILQVMNLKNDSLGRQ
jgi:light-regulated signal transduction histidine kinase (bacteriophytochrome)/ActR/RegA family two-component response regulator